jgi:uncharacterized protein YjbJ (UPF0337 family)
MLKELGGRIKEAVGHLLGRERMHAEGRAEELRGRADVETGKVAERAEGAVQEAAGSVKHDVGDVISSGRMAAEGRAKEIEGQVRQHINR